MQFEVPIINPPVEKAAKEDAGEATQSIKEFVKKDVPPEETYEAKIVEEPVDESEIPEPPHGTEWTPSPVEEAATVEEPPAEVPTNMPADEEPPHAEIIEEITEPVSTSGWEVKEYTGEQVTPDTSPQRTVAQEPAQTVAGKEIELYQWGFPERLNVNTIRIPIFFRDRDSGHEFWSYLTISLDHIYRR
jgi:hypothetical protein